MQVAALKTFQRQTYTIASVIFSCHSSCTCLRKTNHMQAHKCIVLCTTTGLYIRCITSAGEQWHFLKRYNKHHGNPNLNLTVKRNGTREDEVFLVLDNCIRGWAHQIFDMTVVAMTVALNNRFRWLGWTKQNVLVPFQCPSNLSPRLS